ncbi:MAG: hypothetical protein AABN95_11955 [Acidobacteriota bacterium]
MFTRKKFTRTSIIIYAIAGLAAIGFHPASGDGSTAVFAQQRNESTMEQRTKQLLRALAEPKDCETAKAAVHLAIDIAVANNRVLVSKDALDLTMGADRMMSDNETMVAEALGNFAQQGKCPEAQGLALDVKLLIEQGNEVARALRPFTAKCGERDSVAREPCDQLQAHLDEETGHEIYGLPQAAGVIIRPGYSVKLRGPYVPPYIRERKEDIRATAPISPGQCAVVFKETKGLMLRLIFLRFDIVLDPWATPLLARGTRIPVWALQWVPSEHVKSWNICNIGGKIQTTVTQRVKQEIPLHYFWRYYPKDP